MIMAALFCLGFNANAQLNVKRSDTFNKIASSRMGMVQLMEHDNIYYISFPTTNRFDKSFIFYLGEGKEAAVQTLKDLIALNDTIKKEKITIDNAGNDLIISKSAGQMYFSMRGYAGLVATSKMELENLLHSLENKE